jgi:protein-S-isoprenylcysteine O-methyltransferase Ste14
MSGLSLAVAVCWIVFWIYWIVAAVGAKTNVRTSGRQVAKRELPIRLALLVLAVVAIRVARGHGLDAGDAYARPGSYWRAGGFVVLVVGLSLAVWARRALGKNWGMPMARKQRPELVTTGPYRFVRHPIYSGLLLALVGTAIASGLIWLFVMALAAIYFIYSALSEERIMSKKFPGAYPVYKQRTKMLIPFVL